MRKDSFKILKKVINNSQTVSIVTHWSPDGDAIGSSLALNQFLKYLNKNVKVIVPNAFPDFLEWMPGSKQILNFQEEEKKCENWINKSDLIFTLDFNSYKRIEKLGDVLIKTPVPKIMIDHHQQPDDYAKYYYHDINACSTCELIFELICGLGKKKVIDKKIAACIYTGLMSDTGSFRYPSVSSDTHAIIAELLKTGIVPSEIHASVYDNYSIDRLKLLGYALSEKMKIIDGYPVAYFCLSNKELKQFHFQKGDTEGLVNYPFAVKGIKVCALFNESEDYVKISFRSKDKIDVNAFARKYFNGGGHINAAGGKSDLSLNETEINFIKHVKTLF